MPRNRSSRADEPGDGRRERWRAHREARRRELVRAVVDVVRRTGPGVGMDDIAAATGVAKQVFYRYFADKKDLQQAVGRAAAGAVVREVAAAIEAQTEVRSMLAAGIGAYLRLVASEPELYRYVVQPPPGGTDPVEDYQTLLCLQVSRLVGERLRAAGDDAGAAEPWGFALVGAVRAATDRWLQQPTMSRDALCEYLTEFAWSGLARIGDAPEAAAGKTAAPVTVLESLRQTGN